MDFSKTVDKAVGDLTLAIGRGVFRDAVAILLSNTMAEAFNRGYRKAQKDAEKDEDEDDLPDDSPPVHEGPNLDYPDLCRLGPDDVIVITDTGSDRPYRLRMREAEQPSMLWRVGRITLESKVKK